MKILAIILGLFVLAIGGCIAVIGLAADDVVDSINEFERDQEELGSKVEAAADITACTLDQNGNGEVTVEFENPLDEEKGYIGIEINFLDGDTVVGSATVVFENLDPGEKAIEQATGFGIVDGVESVTCKVADSTVF